MRTPFALSVFLHCAVFVLSWVGLPHAQRPIIEPEQVIEVEVVSEVEAKEPEPEPEPELEPKVAALPPPEPPPPPPPPPEPEVVEVPPPPEEKKEPESEPEPKPEPKPEKKAEEKPKVKSPPRPRFKPKPPAPDEFASVLKSVEKLERKKKEPKKKPKKQEFDEDILNVLKKHKTAPEKPKQTQLANLAGRVTQSDKDAIRRQIERCWNPPVGAPNAEELTVELRLHVNPDGMVQAVNVIDSTRAESDPFFRAAVDSARRAVLHPRCRKLNFPLEKYDQLKTLTIVFDPREMLGR